MESRIVPRLCLHRGFEVLNHEKGRVRILECYEQECYPSKTQNPARESRVEPPSLGLRFDPLRHNMIFYCLLPYLLFRRASDNPHDSHRVQ